MSNIPSEVKFYNCAGSSFIADNSDYSTGNPATDVVSLAKHEGVMFIIVKGDGAVGTATITVESCDDTTPTTTTAVAYRYKKTTSGDTEGAWTAVASTGFTTTAGSDQCYVIDVKASELSGTDKYVRLQLTEVNSTACDGAVLCCLYGPRYARSVPSTDIV